MAKGDRILILIMSCRAEFFQNEVKRICSTWGSRLPKDTCIGYYDGAWERAEIDIEDGGVIHVKSTSPDDLEHTFLKTWDALSQLYQGNDTRFDWIFRVNTSTWVNVPLLRKFVDEIATKDNLYASDIYSLTEAACPQPLDLYARGNAFLMSDKIVNILLVEGISLMYLNVVDDAAMGNVINSYFIKQSHSFDAYIDHIKGLPHGWYKCVNKHINTGHALCDYCGSETQDFYNRLMTVQTKMYRNREQEHKNMEDFYNMMKDAPEPSLDCAVEYMKNPSIFIGSILGYISLADWKKVGKAKLYAYEMSHKAIDDKQNKNYSQEEYEKLHQVPGMEKPK